MIRDIDTNLLRSFLAIVDAGSMTAAARVVNLTQAAISQQVKRLEDLFDVKLFDRAGKQLQLTPEGALLLPEARRMVSLNDEIVARMAKQDSLGTLRVGVPCDLIGVYLPPILRSFRQSHPQVRVSLVTATSWRLQQMLDRGDVDLALSTDVAPAPGQNALKREPLVWIGGPSGTAYRERPLPLSIGDETCAFRAVAVPALQQQRIDFRLACETEENVVLAVVEADLGVSIMLASVVPASVDILGSHGELPKLPDFYINLQPPRGGAPAVASQFADHVRRHFALRFRGSERITPRLRPISPSAA